MKNNMSTGLKLIIILAGGILTTFGAIIVAAAMEDWVFGGEILPLLRSIVAGTILVGISGLAWSKLKD
jgi:hypothetical protein